MPMQFSHLHVHTQFSLLDGATNISKMIDKAVADNMPAVAITDHGNMYGVFKFVAEAAKKGIKPIIGCEFYLVADRTQKTFTKEKRDVRRHQLFLAKNEEGYKNLIKLCSLGYIEGAYGKFPRIDKELVLKYHKGLIATTCCIGASIPQAILKHGEEAGEKEFKWWFDIFGEDFYVELQNHQIPDQLLVNEALIKLAIKYNCKIIASNDAHYLEKEDANAHDILLCINTGEKQSTPVYKEADDSDENIKGGRFGFYNDEFYFKNTAEMTQLWSHLPAAIDNTNEIVGKVETLKLHKEIALPFFQFPTEFQSQDQYLRHLTYQGAEQRYGEITVEIKERLDFELFTIETMGFAGYFLIVGDFIKEGKNMGVFIGPGRGSAAGSAVAYCIGITNIDPIKYNLLFERFLNPDRKSMPDIDTDFDDEGRQKVIDYVVDKYGYNQVAQIVTYGTMAAKSSIKDVARVLDLDLNDSNYLAKLVPDKPGTVLERVLKAPFTGDKSLADKEAYGSEDLENIKILRDILENQPNTLKSKVLTEALKLEGSVRNVGIHAAGVIIAPGDLSDILPVSTSKESKLLITQFEGKIIEDAGVIKMDFLGLKTLSIIRDALLLIEENHGVTISIDDVPLDDPEVYKLYQKGETNATFQFESAGMQKHLINLKPDKFADLIAMNALYRPGPMDYIPSFVKRKHGTEEISYDLEDMKEYLEETYGITVYQEQVMLLSQKIAGFTKGDADTLRKAMGKKDLYTLEKLKPKFFEGATAKGHPEDKLNKIWTDWQAFAQYAFNKSHATCYAFVAYQTGYLKTHYPSEFMAAVMSNSLGNIDKITFFMEECKRMGLDVLGPDVNESSRAFAVNKKGQIRFGLAAIKGAGDAAVESIIEERKTNGLYTDIFDFATRVNSRTVNKKTMESLVFAGGFDCFTELNRATYFDDSDGSNFLEKLSKYASKESNNNNTNQVSLFGGTEDNVMATPKPRIPTVEPWGNLQKLKYEKEVIGIFLTGHPLDDFKVEIDTFCTTNIENIYAKPEGQPLLSLVGKEIKFAGIVTKAAERTSKNGKPFMSFAVEDFSGNLEMMLFGKDYVDFHRYINQDLFLYFQGRIDKRWNGEDVEIKLTKIELLADIREKLSRELRIGVLIDSLDEALIGSLFDILDTHAGNTLVKIVVIDNIENIEIEFLSRKYKIDPNNHLFSKLNELVGIEYKLI